ncbi:zinc-dependent peptidase [Hydrogenimonas sp. SS33]|uniref:M90 family metallopeptidase n=1 Tax=Hydrogenimonas leucolamina TaxID=2954236 RepID=UPI00336C0921
MYYIALMQLFATLLALFLAWQAWGYFRRMWLWKKVQHRPLPPAIANTLKKIPHYRLLPDDLKRELHPRLLFFIETKQFMGVKIDVTDEMRATIAFYACLMVLKIPDECFDNLVTILIYPYDVVAKQVEAEGGIYREGAFVLEGQSVADTVVIAWNEAKRQAHHLWPHNVIVHELAHVLDFEDGMPDGVPPLQGALHRKWTQVLYRRFNDLKKKALANRDWGEYRIIGSYAAANEAEFFAVVSELFFQKPKTLKRHFPDIYDLLKSFYGLDTAAIFAELDEG